MPNATPSTPHACGDAGGTTVRGTPCKRRTAAGEVCAIHTGEAKVGRPPFIFTDEQVGQVEKLAYVLNQDQIADFFGLTDRTLRAKIKTDARISSAYARGRAKAASKLGFGLLKDAIAGDARAREFYLRTQAGWSERQTHEHTGKDGGPIETRTLLDVSNASPEDLARAYRDLLAG